MITYTLELTESKQEASQGFEEIILPKKLQAGDAKSCGCSTSGGTPEPSACSSRRQASEAALPSKWRPFQGIFPMWPGRIIDKEVSLSRSSSWRF